MPYWASMLEIGSNHGLVVRKTGIRRAHDDAACSPPFPASGGSIPARSRFAAQFQDTDRAAGPLCPAFYRSRCIRTSFEPGTPVNMRISITPTMRPLQRPFEPHLNYSAPGDITSPLRTSALGGPEASFHETPAQVLLQSQSCRRVPTFELEPRPSLLPASQFESILRRILEPKEV